MYGLTYPMPDCDKACCGGPIPLIESVEQLNNLPQDYALWLCRQYSMSFGHSGQCAMEYMQQFYAKLASTEGAGI